MKLKKHRASLEQILAATSDVLFPAQIGKQQVALTSRDSDGDTPLHVVVRRNEAYAVHVLLKAGADVNAVGDMSETPLHVAVRQGNAAIVEALLEAGADVDLRSEFNETPRELARRSPEFRKLFKHFGHT